MRTWFLMLLVVSLVTCCDQAPAPGDGESASLEQAVYTTFHPTAWMAERIAGGAVPVICPLPTGEDAIFWKPSRDVLARYQGAQVVVVNGAEFEKWVAGASLPRSRTCDTVAGLDDQFITYEGVTHSHGGSEGTHTHEGIDGHTWVDPEMAKVQARAIAAAMAKAWPEDKATFDEGLSSVVASLDQWKEGLAALKPALGEVTLLASHPAYNYLARSMGWDIKNLDLDPEAAPTGAQLAEIQLKLEGGKPKRVILWEGAPTEETKKLLRDRFGLISVEFSPAENLDQGFSAYDEVMGANLKRLQAALR